MEKPVLEIKEQEQNKDYMERMEALLKENLEMSQEMRIMVRHINTYVAWRKVFAWVKLLLILIPVIIGFIYLPPLFQDFYQQFISFMSGGACQ